MLGIDKYTSLNNWKTIARKATCLKAKLGKITCQNSLTQTLDV